MQSHSSEWKWLRPNTLLLLFLIYFSRFSKQNNITHHHHRRKILKKLQVHWLLEKPLQQQENLAHCKLCFHLLVYNKCNNFCNTWSTTTITTTSTLSFSRNFCCCCLFYFFFREIEIHFMFYSNNGGLAPGFNPTHLQHFMQQSNLLNQHQVSAYCYNYFYLRMSKFLILKFIPIILF